MAFPLGERRCWKSHRGYTLVQVEEYDAIDCESCGFIHVVPIPSAEELADYYRTKFYEDSKPDYFVKAERDRNWLNIDYDMKLVMLDEALEASLEHAESPRRILDIGSGPGHFLVRAKRQGWAALGLEASPAAVEFARSLGADVHEGYFDGTGMDDLGKFEAIHMQHVLEHAPDPVQLLSGLRELLRPGGAVCVEVPNDFSVVQEVLHCRMGFPAWWVAPPEHLNYFSKASLGELLTRSGFSAVHWTSQFPVDLALVSGLDYVRDPSVGSEVHEWRMRLETRLAEARPELLRDLYTKLLEVGIGRQLIVVASARP